MWNNACAVSSCMVLGFALAGGFTAQVQHSSQHRRNQFCGGEGQPHADHAADGRQQKGHRDDEQQAAQQRGDVGGDGVLHRGEVGGEDGVEGHKGDGGEVELEPFHRNLLQLGVVFAVEDLRDGAGEQKQDKVDHSRQRNHRGHGAVQQLAGLLPQMLPVGAADEGLDALSDAVVDGDHHQRDVGDDAVGGDAGVAGKAEDDGVKDDHGDAGGHLRQQRRKAQRDVGAHHRCAQAGAGQVEALALFEPVRRHDEDADDRGEAGGQNGAEDAHPHREDKDVVQHDVGEAAGDGGGGGKLRVAVVADEAEEEVVEDEGGGEQDHGLQVGIGHVKDGLVRTKKEDQLVGKEQADQKKDNGKSKTEVDGVGEHDVGFVLLAAAFADGKAGRAAHAQHQPDAVDKVVGGNGQIERGKAVCPQTLGDKEGVRQDVTGHGEHAEDAEGRIFGKIPQNVVLAHSISPSKMYLDKRKALSFHISNGLSMWNTTLLSARRQNLFLQCSLL